MAPPSLETRIQQLEHAVVAFARVELGDSGPKPDEDRDSHGEWSGGGGGGDASGLTNPNVSGALGKTGVGDTATVHVNDPKNPNATGGGAAITGTVTAVDKNGITIKGADGKETHVPTGSINNLHSSGADANKGLFGAPKGAKKGGAKKGGGKGGGKKGGGAKKGGGGSKKTAGHVPKAKAPPAPKNPPKPKNPTKAQLKIWNDTIAANNAKAAAGR